MKSNKRTSSNIQPYSLERSLAPLWKVTYYGCLLLDWCRAIQSGRFLTISRCIAIVLNLCIFSYQLLSFGFQLIHAMASPEKELEDLIVSTSHFATLPLIFLTWLLFLIRRRPLLDFFKDWARLEKATPLWSVDHARCRQIVRTAYRIYAAFNFSFFLFLLYVCATMNFKTFKGDILLNYFPCLSNFTWFSVGYRIGFLLWGFSLITFFTIFDLVPCLVYYHAAKNVQAIETEIQTDMLFETNSGLRNSRIVNTEVMGVRLKLIWTRSEYLRKLIIRADILFGPIIIFNHGTTFLNICCQVFHLLKHIKDRNGTDPSYGTPWPASILFITVNVVRLFFSVILMSKIQKKSDSLVSTLTKLSLCLSCQPEHKEERRIVKSFLNRLQFSGFVAFPSGFYTITPSILLTMFSLIVTYTIIMLQQA